MSWFSRLIGSGKHVGLGVLRSLTCSSCGHAFHVGDDAGLVTDEQVEEFFRSHETALRAPDGQAQPDLVKHVVFDNDVLKRTEEALLTVFRALSSGKKRFWYCGECEFVNPYPGYEEQLKDGIPPKKTYVVVKKENDPEKQFQIGLIFFAGKEVPQNYGTAADWFRKAAEQGHREAQFTLATSYHAGMGVPQDNKLAYHWYLKAAEQGHPASQRTVGIACFNGGEMQKDVTASIAWLEKAAVQGDAGALYNLGACYYNGTGVRQDEERALELINRAASLGHEQATQVLKQISISMSGSQRYCDVCITRNAVAIEECFVLATSQIVISAAFWDITLEKDRTFVNGIASREERTRYLEGRVSKIASDSADWLVCSSCSRLFAFDKTVARRLALSGERSPIGGPSDVETAMKAAFPVILRMTDL